MSARLALDLDHDAIRLLSHQSDGWVVEAVAELDTATLPQKIAALRQRAEDLVGPDPSVLVVLPRSQVLYARFEGLVDPEREVPERLAARTACALSEITWDQATTDEGATDVAAVTLETLDEALAFAASCRFRVVGLTSEPPEGEFPRLPVFQRLPGFLREKDAPRPLVLEPATPPARAEIAFSEQRDADYGPKRPLLPLVAVARTREAARTLPLRLAEAWKAVPKPLAGAALAGGVLILATALWPEGDPDPFSKRNADRSFATLHASLEDGLRPPAEMIGPLRPAGLEEVTVLRGAPPIAVPVVLGSSGVSADVRADIGPASAFARLAGLPTAVEETFLPEAAPPRPVAIARPTLLAPEAPGRSGLVAAAEPATADSPDADLSSPRVASAPDGERPPAEVTVLALPEAPSPPAPSTDIPTPDLLATAPTETLAPAEDPGLELAIAPFPGPAALSDATDLPPATDLAEPLPDAAIALLPPEAEDRFDLGPDGFVVPTPEGALTPGGVLALSGAPPLVAPPRPGSDEEVVAAAPDPAGETVAAAPEPSGETVEEEPAPVEVARVNPNPELVAFLPRPRPETAPDPETVPEELIAEALEAEDLAAEPEPLLTASLMPRPRPERAVATAPASAPPSVETAAATRAAPSAPSIPSRANVAREATIDNALPLGQINLIGVYGSASDRRALVRLPTGRFVKLKVGDRLDGGQVAQIGPDRLLYQKGSRTLALEMPNT